LVELRKTYGEQFQKRHNLKLGFMSAFVKATAAALQDQPIVNAGKYLFLNILKYKYFFLNLNPF
jgi:pyruvate/2-oxoglutarate dehydrogenase complex dihydrolipoamide acyltransferase (E2) component